jgi:hypothetical protein
MLAHVFGRRQGHGQQPELVSGGWLAGPTGWYDPKDSSNHVYCTPYSLLCCSRGVSPWPTLPYSDARLYAKGQAHPPPPSAGCLVQLLKYRLWKLERFELDKAAQVWPSRSTGWWRAANALLQPASPIGLRQACGIKNQPTPNAVFNYMVLRTVDIDALAHGSAAEPCLVFDPGQT